MKTYIKNLVKKYIRDPYRNKNGVFTYYGHRVFFPKDSEIFKIAMNEGGLYERENLRLIPLFLKPGTTLFDVGANIGLMAVPFLWNDPTIKVISVEASPNSLFYLNKTHAASLDKDRWMIIDKAVSDKPGEVDFHLSDNSNSAYDGLKNTQRVNIVNTIKVECTTIDKIWESQQKPDVSFIKIDIEGADILALKGGLNCINSCRPVILIEWNQINIKSYGFTNIDLINFVTEISYELYYLPELNRISNLVELNILCKKKYIENYMLIPVEKTD
ncbi:MAG: hypothetical protein JWQ57_561 [Mucilaginibacter sp.]|nr:hypothetical protein [Mucilaginibacter sp.]